MKLSITLRNKNYFLVLLFFSLYVSAQTTVSIADKMFYIDGIPTYQGRYWKEHKIEGLLFNSRMVQGIFDDLNKSTRERFKYPDTNEWSAARNTEEFVQAMEEWKKHGLLAFTLNLQGGSPMGYGNEGWVNSTFDEKGSLRPAYMNRLKQILDKANELKMVVILGYFYFGQDQHLKDEEAVIKAVDNITDWILDRSYKNILIEVNNECNVRYDHEILQPQRVHELIERIKGKSKKNYRLLVGTSYGGGTIPKSNVVQVSDFILLHGNGVNKPNKIEKMVADTKMVEGYTDQPIVFNEDDHFNFDQEENNFVAAIKSNASWGYFDFRMKDENYESGFQSVPVDWGINSERKKSFFSLLKEITGY